MKGLGIDHVEFRVSNYDRSVRFYDELMLPLGFKKGHVKGEIFTYYLRGTSALGIRPVKKRKAPGNISYSYKTAGLHHVAISVQTKSDVDDLYQLLLRKRVKILYPPKKYPRYGRWYYSVFFLDPDGIDLEVVCWSKPLQKV